MNFAVVGSRKVTIEGNEEFPSLVYRLLKNVAYGLALRKFKLICCGAKGADQAGLDGTVDGKGEVEFCLPCDNHNKHQAPGVHPTSGYVKDIAIFWNEVYAPASSRPPFERMGDFVQMLFIRSAIAVDKSNFIVTYAKDESLGGTAFTIAYARHKGVTVFNLYNGLEPLKAYIKEVKNA